MFLMLEGLRAVSEKEQALSQKEIHRITTISNILINIKKNSTGCIDRIRAFSLFS